MKRGEELHAPPALLLFDTWHVNDGGAPFRTRVVTSTTADSLDGAARVEWIRKRSEGVFSTLIGIGRTRNNDIVLPMAGVSKYHAYIQHDAETGIFSIADAGSKNGTLVDGMLLSPREPFALRDNTALSFAGTECRFRLTSTFFASLSVSLAALTP